MKTKKKTIKCPYCGGTAVLRDAAVCMSALSEMRCLYVGVHKGTQIPKGTLADGDLRNLRIRAHRMFDMIWQNGILTRKNAYRWIQDKFSLRSDQAHIGHFSEYMCRRLIEESQTVLENNHIMMRGERCG